MTKPNLKRARQPYATIDHGDDDCTTWPFACAVLRDVEWALRHGNDDELREVRMVAASVVSAYMALIDKPQRSRADYRAVPAGGGGKGRHSDAKFRLDSNRGRRAGKARHDVEAIMEEIREAVRRSIRLTVLVANGQARGRICRGYKVSEMLPLVGYAIDGEPCNVGALREQLREVARRCERAGECGELFEPTPGAPELEAQQLRDLREHGLYLSVFADSERMSVEMELQTHSTDLNHFWVLPWQDGAAQRNRWSSPAEALASAIRQKLIPWLEVDSAQESTS